MKSGRKIILGLLYGGHDTAASLMVDGRIVAACEQERYTGDKHSRRFPKDAIYDCLDIARITINQVDEIAVAADMRRFIRDAYLRPALLDDGRIGRLIRNIETIRLAYFFEDKVRTETNFKGRISFHRHHLCHLAATYFPSGFQDALLVCYDGVGENRSSMIGRGRSGNIEVIHEGNIYPNSLGRLYSAVTNYLGWNQDSDEGTVMALAAYGNPQAPIPGTGRSHREIFTEILQETGDYDFIVEQSWLADPLADHLAMSARFTDLCGPPRPATHKIEDIHMHVAAALQERLEQVVINQLSRARKAFGLSRLCLGGGVALNCSLNGKIVSSGLFDEVFVPPASGDNGVTTGACYLADLEHHKPLPPRREHQFFLGSEFDDDQIRKAVDYSGLPFSKPAGLINLTAELLAAGRIVGWFQGRAEFGPRALGHRSILCRPFPAGMRDKINDSVKFREWFRPFAAAVMNEDAADYFAIEQESPYMLIASPVRPAGRALIPAVVHADGSCRVQTVRPDNDPGLYDLLAAFKRIAGIPVLLNTSFNVKGQPIVNTPEQAIKCFQVTALDCIVIGNYICLKS